MPNAIVGHVWLAAKNCEDVLKGHQKYPLFKGVRSKPITSLNPNDPKPKGRGSMHDEAWRNGLAILAEYNLSFDLRVPYWHLYEAAQIISELPKLSVVLNHTGFPWNRSPRGLSEWRQAMKAIAQCPNVFLKLSELGLKDAAWTVDSNRGVVLDAIDIFGVERCMWASNFPVEATSLPDVGSGYDPSIETLMGMRPDLVIVEALTQARFVPVSYTHLTLPTNREV